MSSHKHPIDVGVAGSLDANVCSLRWLYDGPVTCCVHLPVPSLPSLNCARSARSFVLLLHAKTTTKIPSTMKADDHSDQRPVSGDRSLQEGQRETQAPKKPWYNAFLTPGHALQIVTAAIIAIAIGMAVVNTVDDIHPAVPAIIIIPGDLWLRSLRAVVLPLIATAMILAVVRLREMSSAGGAAGKLGRWVIGWYITTTLVAIVHSSILVGVGWSRLFVKAPDDSLVVDEDAEEQIEERSGYEWYDVIVELFRSFIPNNIVSSLAEDGLLAVLITSVVVGFLIEKDGSLIRAVEEIERMITKVVKFLIMLAPVGVFFLILANLFKLDIASIGQNLGALIGSSVVTILFHLFVVLPLLFFLFTRENPYTFWLKCSPAWITAWGTASSAATLSVTMRCLRERGIPDSIVKFAAPLGCLINMDGTAIYFPCVVVFMAVTQGITLNPGQYVIAALLSALSSIGTTPIPSSSLVLTVMICTSVNVPVTGMFAVVVAIDWFIDRFRTACNVSGDLFAARVVVKVTGITDEDLALAADEAETEVRQMTTDQRV